MVIKSKLYENHLLEQIGKALKFAKKKRRKRIEKLHEKVSP